MCIHFYTQLKYSFTPCVNTTHLYDLDTQIFLKKINNLRLINIVCAMEYKIFDCQ